MTDLPFDDEPLAPVSALLNRLELDQVEGLDAELDAKIVTLATGALEDASTEVRHYGSHSWTVDSVPPMARKIAISAAKRYMDNRMGLIQSRAGDETLMWDAGDEAGSVSLTKREIEVLGRLTAAPDFDSVGTFAWSDEPARSRRDVLYVRTDGGSLFPWETPGSANDDGGPAIPPQP